MGLRDIISRMPRTQEETLDYILANYQNIREKVESSPQYKAALEQSVKEAHAKYSSFLDSKYLKGVSMVSGAGHALGYSSDLYLLSGDIIGTLGGKFLNLLAQIPEKAYSIFYGFKTGNYLDTVKSIFQGLISYIPGLTFIDEGLPRIIRKRMVSEALITFEKLVGEHKPWTQKISDNLKEKYTGVKDRIDNVFTPDYQPYMAR